MGQFHQIVGYRIEVEAVLRSFHDTREVAIAMAGNIKRRNKQAKVEIVCEASGKRAQMLEDGRIA